jgi:hypothetical protein
MPDLSWYDCCRMATRHLAFTHYVACPEAEGYSEPERTSTFLKRSNPPLGRNGRRSRTTSGGDGIVDVDGGAENRAAATMQRMRFAGLRLYVVAASTNGINRSIGI